MNKELHLNAQIGDYDIDYVVLDLGLEVNVMTKQTWALMGKPKLIYFPIRLRMANQCWTTERGGGGESVVTELKQLCLF
jgi:hypothetical protein